MWYPNAQPKIESALHNWQADHTGTLVFVTQAEHVLLIVKKTGHGQGLINGPGGKLEPNETPIDCARRELQEELGVAAKHFAAMARLRFIDTDGPQWLGYVYCASELDGVPTESAEAKPVWYPTTELPLENMWPDDAIWLPLVLQGQALEGDFLLSAETLLCARWRPATWRSDFSRS